MVSWIFVIASAFSLQPSAIVVMAVVFCIAALFCYRCGNRAQQNVPLAQLELCRVSGPRPFQYDELAAATNNFANENKLGHGGFGPSLRGILEGPRPPCGHQDAICRKFLAREKGV
jgi:hypothetical protein